MTRVSPRQWAGLLIAALVVAFVLMNRDEIPISVFGVKVTGPAWVLLFLVFVVGWLVGVLTHRRRRRGRA